MPFAIAAPPLPPRPPSTPHGHYAQPSLRIRVANWMERTFGKAYLPIAMMTGGVAGAALGSAVLGPVGMVAGGAAGAMLGGVLVFAG